MKALIVDDKEENRYLLEALLRGNGHDVVAATNGAEALERLKPGGFDLIISDILMPIMDGFQLCRKVKTDKALCHIPFIIYTATYTGPQDEVFAIKIGADRFIQKPCEPEVFIEAVRDVMEAAKHRDIAPTPELAKEEDVLKLYNERLVRKLEQKMLQAEREIQARQEIEESLRASEQKYRLLAEYTMDIIWAMDLNLEFTYVNPAIHSLMGYSPEEWIGSRLPEHCDEENLLKMTQVITDELAKGPTATGVILEAVLLDKNRKPIPVEIHGRVVFDENGAPILLQGVTRNISERKRAEEERNKLTAQLLQAQKLESIGNLAGGIAHDFNNILTSIIGFTEIALDDVEKGSNIEDSLQEIYNAGKRAKDLVKQILAFARKTDEEIKPIKTKSIMNEVLKFLRSSIPTTINIRQNITSNASIMGNPTQLHQVLMNLCTNAVYAMEGEGGILEVGLEDTVIHEEHKDQELGLKPGNYVKLTVSDTGTGISPENIGSIFEPYFTTKSHGEGTGFGLSVVHGIVEKYGGKIKVESELGEGSVFSIYLPIIKTTEIHRPYEIEILPTGSERILFVDDELPIAKMGSQILERLGYRVTARTSSIEALELFKSRSNDFDLVVTDMTMPNMTGDKLAIELMKVRSDMPVILCTGYSKKISNVTAAEIGIKAFVYKPTAKADLARTVRKVLDEAKGTDQ